MALVVLSVVEQRLDAVRAARAGAEVTDVAADMGCTGRRCTGGRRGIWSTGRPGWPTGRARTR